jgi:ABC-type cobalamin transport system permease subunit
MFPEIFLNVPQVLGELSFLKDKFTLTDMGPVSMYQMMYWMMTTVSTVGYRFWLTIGHTWSILR